MVFRLIVLLAILTTPFPSFLAAADGDAEQLQKEIAAFELEDLIRSAIGVTRQGTPIRCFLAPEDLDPDSPKFRVLLIGGLDGKIESSRAVLEALTWFRNESKDKETIALSAVPCAHPDVIEKADFTPHKFPPKDNAYNQPENDEAHYLWRWTGMHAPDLVVVVLQKGKERRWYPVNDVSDVRNKVPFLGELPNGVSPESFFGDPFAIAAFAKKPGELGRIRSLECHILEGADGRWLAKELPLTSSSDAISNFPSARKELRRRTARSPIEVAEELAKVYGKDLNQVAYIPALAVRARHRLGVLTGNPNYQQEAEAVCAPYLSGEKPALGEKFGGSQLSGHLIFSYLGKATGNGDYTPLAKVAADTGFDSGGKPLPSMPAHSEMSDAVFMGCAILAETGELTGDEKYFEQCLRHLRFMEKLCLRDDGLYRHSPLDEAAWGRGNGFPALGLSLSLSALPKDSPHRDAFLKAHRHHLEALRKHQDPTGAWHQVIDHPESYREFTCTCMITFAIVRGIRRGWLDEAEWTPVVEKSWQAIKQRIGPGGRLVDVCTGTGKQKDLRAYHDRTAILGTDPRGGAMAMLVSVEMAAWERETKNGNPAE